MSKKLQQIVDSYDWEGSGEALASSMSPLYSEVVSLGRDAATQELEALGLPGHLFDTRREELDAVPDLLAQQIKGVSSTTKGKVQDIVNRQGLEGLSIPETAKLIRETGLTDSRSRSRTIARTETGMAYNMATVLTYGSAGVTHVVVDDGDEDEPCKSANGQIWTLEEAAANPLGHPNCQRSFRPYLENIQQPTSGPTQQDPEPEPFADSPEPTYRPVGTPVSAALRLPGGKLGKELQEAQASIDSVHGDGSLMSIPVTSSSGTRTLGQYAYSYSGDPRGIKVSSKGAHPQMTYAHEVGHFLDHQGLNTHSPRGTYGTRAQDPTFKEFREAVIGSSTHQHNLSLKNIRTTQIQGSDGRTYTQFIDRSYVNYLTSEVEVWARAYAQYIAVRSGSPAMRRELDEELKSTSAYRQQWDDADFEPIAKAMDALFEAQGWREKVQP